MGVNVIDETIVFLMLNHLTVPRTVLASRVFFSVGRSLETTLLIQLSGKVADMTGTIVRERSSFRLSSFLRNWSILVLIPPFVLHFLLLLALPSRI